jgi:hypothetical protein
MKNTRGTKSFTKIYVLKMMWSLLIRYDQNN